MIFMYWLWFKLLKCGCFLVSFLSGSKLIIFWLWTKKKDIRRRQYDSTFVPWHFVQCYQSSHLILRKQISVFPPKNVKTFLLMRNMSGLTAARRGGQPVKKWSESVETMKKSQQLCSRCEFMNTERSAGVNKCSWKH